MKSYNFIYSNYENLREYIKANNIDIKPNVLVQVYSGIIDKEFISEIITKIKVLMPQCKIIGATSAAEIFEGKTYTKKCEISINLLLQDITNNLTRDLIMEKLANSKNPTKVVFEIVESEGIENFDIVIDFIKEVKKYGAKVAIDDFGTGYSNFSYLMKLNVDYIKIDGSIIKNLHKDKSAEIITKTLVSFAKELGIETVAEFVAEEDVYNKIRNLNIDYSQGYYFSEPKPFI